MYHVKNHFCYNSTMSKSLDEIKNKSFCTFYIVRHGETEWNRSGKLQGHGDSDLTELGVRQAKSVARELKNVEFDHIYSSDLLRAKKTAEIIALEHKLAIKTTKLLRERNWGKYEGKNREVFIDINKLVAELTRKERFSFKINPEIESDEEIVSRLITFIREVAVGNPNKTMLVATHGGIMRAFLIHIGFGDYESLKTNMIENTAYFKLISDGVEFYIEKTKGIHKVQ